MRTRPVSGALVLAAAMTLAGCVDNDVSLSISRFIPPDPAALTSGMCKFDPQQTLSQARGVYDITIAKFTRTGYETSFVVANNLLLIDNAPVDTQFYTVNSYDVTLEVKGPIQTVIPASKREFNVPTASLRLAPQGVAAALVQVIDPAYIDDMIGLKVAAPGSITAHLRPVATRGENEVVGAYAQIPIEVCNGCLSGAPEGAFAACPYTTTSTPSGGNICNPPQDEPIDCCLATQVNSTKQVLLCGNAAKPSTS